MPELPEVETSVRDLAHLLAGAEVATAEVRWMNTIAAPLPELFCAQLAGQRFTGFDRRGKYMLLALGSGMTLVVHLRMTGKFQLEAAGAAPDKHTHVIFDLRDGRRLFYRDSRKFGRMWLVADPATLLARLGPEPLGDDFAPALFAGRLAGRTAPIKALLLDQAVVAGVGNIYADEALFRAGIHPRRPAGSLYEEEIQALQQAIREVLAAGIAAGGSSLGASGVQNYVRPTGDMGAFQVQHHAYGRTGAPCHRCGTPIERLVIAQRSSHFCPVCQPLVVPTSC